MICDYPIFRLNQSNDQIIAEDAHTVYYKSLLMNYKHLNKTLVQFSALISYVNTFQIMLRLPEDDLCMQ